MRAKQRYLVGLLSHSLSPTLYDFFLYFTHLVPGNVSEVTVACVCMGEGKGRREGQILQQDKQLSCIKAFLLYWTDIVERDRRHREQAKISNYTLETSLKNCNPRLPILVRDLQINMPKVAITSGLGNCAYNAPDPNAYPCRWWAHRVAAPYCFFGLCPAKPHGSTPGHQMLAGELLSQIWLQGRALVSLFWTRCCSSYLADSYRVCESL